MDKIKIFLTMASGRGMTEEAAYCQALKKAGLINFNLIGLSSVLPHNCKIIRKNPEFSYLDYGKKVYVIMAEARTSKPNEVICAGLGWAREKNGSGYGLVVQMKGNYLKDLKRKIRGSLNEVIKYGGAKYIKKLQIISRQAVCRDRPICVLVALVFDEKEGWQSI